MDDVLLVARAALENHFVWLVPPHVFGRLIAMNPPTDRIERREPDSPSEHLRVVSIVDRNLTPVVIAEVGIKESGPKLP